MIPEGVTTIDGYAFNSCASLTSVTLPSSIRTLGGWSFHGCTALTSITLPDSLISMRNGCFSRCHNLAEVNLGSGLTWLDEGVFWENYALKSIVIPDCVTEIYDNCFYMSGLEEITIPASVTNFRYDSSFEGCDSLRVLHTTQGSYAEQFFSENKPDVTIDYISAE